MEFRQACTGFANALVIAQGLLSAPGTRAVAIVASEKGSSYFFDPQRAGEHKGQLVNLVQMGDGAAAIILGPDDGIPDARIGKNFFGEIALGRSPGFSLAAGGSDRPSGTSGTLEFDHDFAAVRVGGPELFAQGAAAARQLRIGVDTADRVIPHQNADVRSQRQRNCKSRRDSVNRLEIVGIRREVGLSGGTAYHAPRDCQARAPPLRILHAGHR